ILLSYDRRLVDDAGFSAGFRTGFAVAGPPSPDRAPPPGSGSMHVLPLHLEARVAYHVGVGLLARGATRPYMFVAGGLADLGVPSRVLVCDASQRDPNAAACATLSPSRLRALDGYRRSGPGFAAIGFGATYGFTSWLGVRAELELAFTFPHAGVAIAP